MKKKTDTSAGRRRMTIAEAVEYLPGPDEERFAKVLEHESLEVEVYAPRGRDTQTPHTRDELYVVVQGTGEFVNGPDRNPFGPGDVLFVPAGVEHRFEDFTDDLVVWVVFYGPEGGEAGTAESAVGLKMKPGCERCGTNLSVDGLAFICSYECTFCEGCAGVMEYVCTNCGGELGRRP